MDASSLQALVEQVATGRCSPDEAVRRLRRLPYTDLGFARVDHHRDLRQGLPEAIYGPGKAPEHCAAVVGELLTNGHGPVVLTRASEAQVKATLAAADEVGYQPHTVADSGAFCTVTFRPAPPRSGAVVVLTAGTADLPVAAECTAVLSSLGFAATVLADCGVAGLHRLLAEVDTLAAADAVVVIAGHGGCPGQRGRWAHPRPGRGRAHQHRLRRRARRGDRPARHVVRLLVGHHRGGHRQRLRRRLRDRPAAAVSRPADGVAAQAGSMVAWFHCFAGIAGDMALGSLVDAGADAARSAPCSADSASVGGTCNSKRACAAAWPAPGPWSRSGRPAGRPGPMPPSTALVRAAALPTRVETRSLAVFGALASVEAALHRTTVSDVHFHEVGGHDALVDVVGTAAALEVLGVDEVCASAVATGTGMVRSAHGPLPNPAPATVRLLEGIPTYGRDVPVELTTPTGAALLAALSCAFGPLPPVEVRASGFGGGAAELDDLPNCTQVVLGRRTDAGRRRAGANPRSCSRPTSTTSPVSSSATPWPSPSMPERSTPG